MPPVGLTRAERARLADEARQILETNRRTGVSAWGGRRYDFVCPSPSHYPFQWLWDSCFHAIALCHIDPERAKQELRGVVAASQPDGFLPHMTLWERDRHAAALAGYNIRLGGPYWTATSQPPVLAQAVERVFQVTADRQFLADLLGPVRAWYDWWAAVRDPDEDGLVSILQPDESGLDACSKYDSLLNLPGLDPSGLRASMGRLFTAYAPLSDDRQRLALGLFDVEDVMVNSIYAQGLAALARLTAQAGGPPDQRGALEQRAARTTWALIDRCWDAEADAFWDLAGPDERPLRTLTVTSLFPLILPDLTESIAQALVERHLLNPDEFWLPFPLASVAATEPSFDPTFSTGLIWRGPSWVNSNWFLAAGLRAHGYADAAEELAERTLAMVLRGGFREHFNPYTGEGQGAVSFGWTTLVLDLLAHW